MLDERLMEEAREIISRGEFKSMNAFVEVALKDELEKLRKAHLKQAMLDASRDPMFLSDISEAQKDFEHADFEEVN